ncbi:MAG TPA: hypothetical protein O0X39_07235 [Methanocorpusculum sp.]|nr:hypothetical protein [Methanocorpusculum sp.]
MIRYRHLLLCCLVAAAAVLFLASPACADSYPGGNGFNGLNIVYSISGGSVSKVDDSSGFTTTRTISGTCSPGTVKISGTTESTWSPVVSVDVTVSNGEKSDTQNYKMEKTDDSKSFSVSIPVTKSTKKVTFSINMGASYGNGQSRGLRVAGTLENTGYDENAASGGRSGGSEGSEGDGGFPVVPVAAGVIIAGGGAAAAVAISKKGGFSRSGSAKSGTRKINQWICEEPDGTLKVTDPATGEKREYIPQSGKGGTTTYKNPLTDAEYTLEELKDSLASRNENAGLIRKDSAVAKTAISEQHEEFMKNEDTKENIRKIREKMEELNHQDYVDKVHEKYGTTDDKEIRKEQIKKNIENANNTDRYMQRDVELGAVQDTAEGVEKVADVAVDVLGDMTGPAGKVVKDTYTATKSVGTRLSEAHAENHYGKKMYGDAHKDVSYTEAVGQGIVEGGVGVLQNHYDSGWKGAAAHIGGEGVKSAADALRNGKDVTSAVIDGAKSGAENYAVKKGIEYVADSATDIARDKFAAHMEGFGDLGDGVTGNSQDYVEQWSAAQRSELAKNYANTKSDINAVKNIASDVYTGEGTGPIQGDIADANQISAQNEKALAEMREKLNAMKAAKK